MTRDFAFVVADSISAGDMIRAVKGADKSNVVGAKLFDVFRGKGVPDGRKSLAIEVRLQPIEKSYTEEDLHEISERIIASSRKFGANVRHELSLNATSAPTASITKSRDISASASTIADPTIQK